jgi:hypothetical protein
MGAMMCVRAYNPFMPVWKAMSIGAILFWMIPILLVGISIAWS